MIYIGELEIISLVADNKLLYDGFKDNIYLDTNKYVVCDIIIEDSKEYVDNQPRLRINIEEQ